MNTKRKKQILVAVNHLVQVGGSELYTYDLVNELTKHKDIEVEFFAHHLGALSEKLENDLGVSFMSRDQYDLILAAHNTTVKSLYHKGPIVQICHGTIPELEQPSRYADFHVGISEEVCKSLSDKGYPNKLVLNGIDARKKTPSKPLHDQLQVVLSLCQSEQANDLLKTVCKEQGLDFICFDKHRNPTFDIEKQINKADLVIGLGRSVFDAMACGRPCIIFDDRDYNGNKADGYLHPHLFKEYVKKNCSGRYLNFKFTKDDILGELRKYNPNDGDKLREIAVKNLNIENTAFELVNIVPDISSFTRFKKQATALRRRIRKLRKKLLSQVRSS